MKIKGLKVVHSSGAGFQIHAHIDSNIPVDCVEFVMKNNTLQPVASQAPSPMWCPAASDMWIQFKPKMWDEMTSKLFSEMVDAWNEKYGVDP